MPAKRFFRTDSSDRTFYEAETRGTERSRPPFILFRTENVDKRKIILPRKSFFAPVFAYLYENQSKPTMTQNESPRELDIELSEEAAQGEYANLCIISHSTSEFVLDFVRMMPGIPKARVKSRVILAPEHAKRLLLSLQENIERYEAVLGPIRLPQPQSDDTKIAMSRINGEA